MRIHLKRLFFRCNPRGLNPSKMFELVEYELTIQYKYLYSYYLKYEMEKNGWYDEHIILYLLRCINNITCIIVLITFYRTTMAALY